MARRFSPKATCVPRPGLITFSSKLSFDRNQVSGTWRPPGRYGNASARTDEERKLQRSELATSRRNHKSSEGQRVVNVAHEDYGGWWYTSCCRIAERKTHSRQDLKCHCHRIRATKRHNHGCDGQNSSCLFMTSTYPRGRDRGSYATKMSAFSSGRKSERLERRRRCPQR